MPRLDVAVIHRDGSAEIVNAGRPATLVAFSDEHDGKMFPETPREIAWIVHRALGIDGDLDSWLETLEDISAQPADVRLARKIVKGDERARAIVMGEVEAEEGEDGATPTVDPSEAVELLEQIRGAGRSPA